MAPAMVSRLCKLEQEALALVADLDGAESPRAVGQRGFNLRART
jgi:hypothetical protein